MSVLTTAAVATAAIAYAPAAPALQTGPTKSEGSGTVIGAVIFDAESSVITLTYGGPSPRYQWRRVDSDRFVLDFTDARLSRPGTLGREVGRPLMRYALGDRPGGHTVRLTFQADRAIAPSLVIDEAAHTIQVLTLGRTEPSAYTKLPVRPAAATSPAPSQRWPAMPRTVRSLIGRPWVDAAGTLIVPYRGAAPALRSAVLASDKRWFILDLPGAAPAPAGLPYGRFGDAVFAQWGMARQPQKVPKHTLTRVSLRAVSPQRFQVALHPELHQIWVTVPGRHAAPSEAPEPPLAALPALAAPFPVPSGMATATPISQAAAWVAAPTSPPGDAPALEQPQPVQAPPVQPGPTKSGAPVPMASAVPVAPSTPRPVRVPVETRLTAATFDAASMTLRLPYSGSVPSFSRQRLSPTAMNIDFAGATFTSRRTQMQAFGDHALLDRWVARDVAAEGVARITFNTKRPIDVVVGVDTARHELLLIPEPLDAAPAGAPSVPSTVFGRAYVDEAIGALVLPYRGAFPVYAASVRPPGIVDLEFVGAALERTSVQLDTRTATPEIAYWRLSKRAGAAPRVHLALTLTGAGQVRMLDDRANHRLLVVPAVTP